MVNEWNDECVSNLLPNLLEAVYDWNAGDGVDPGERLEADGGEVVLASDLAEVDDRLRGRVNAQHAVTARLVDLKQKHQKLFCEIIKKSFFATKTYEFYRNKNIKTYAVELYRRLEQT